MAEFSVVPLRPAVNQTVVDMLKDWLADAERGELVAVALCGVCADGKTQSAASRTQNLAALCGAIVRLQHRIQVKQDEEG